MSVLLCLEGLLVLLGILIVIAGDFQFLGRYIYANRRRLMGFVVFITAPLAIFLGEAALGGTPPGPIVGATPMDARNRIIAAVVEWAVILVAINVVLFIWVSAPKEKPRAYPLAPDDNTIPNTTDSH